MMKPQQEPTLQAAFTAASRYLGGGIGTLSERTLHSTLKFWLQPQVAQHEVTVGSSVADLFDGETVTEVQTMGLYPLRKKLQTLLTAYPVTVVLPQPHRKWVCWIDPATGEQSEWRRSPKTGKPWDVLPELFWIAERWKTPAAHPLTVRVLLMDMEEYRLQDGWGRDGKRGSHRADRCPLQVAEEIWLRGFADVRALCPPLPPQFGTPELARALGMRGRTLWRATRFLEESGVIVRVGKQGRSIVYEKT